MKRSALALRVEQIRFADLTQHPYRYSHGRWPESSPARDVIASPPVLRAACLPCQGEEDQQGLSHSAVIY